MKVLSLLGCVDPRVVVAWCKQVFCLWGKSQIEETLN